MLAAAGLANNPYGGGYVPFNYAGLAGNQGQGVAGPAGAPSIDSVNNILHGIDAGASGNIWNPVPTGTGGGITIPPMPTLFNDQGAGDQVLKNIKSYNQGQIPLDVIQQLANLGAERGAGRGFGVDSANTNAAIMRAMGLTSLGLTQQGADDYSKYMATQLGQEQLQHQYWANQLQAAIAQAALELGYYKANQPYQMPHTSGMQLPQNRTPTVTFPGWGATPAPSPSPTPFPTPTPTPTPAPTTPAPPDPGWFDWTSEYGTGGGTPAPTDYPWMDWPDTGEFYPADTYYDPFTDTSNYDYYGFGDYYEG